MNFPRVVRLDGSDPQVFERAAEPGEWAVPGSFAFADLDPDSLDRRQRLAFRIGWLGTESFGRATFAEVAEIEEAELYRVVERLARHLVAHYGAPTLPAALPAAREEADYASGLCEHRSHTLLAIDREWGDQGTIVERFRVIRPERAPDHARIWEIVPEDDGQG